MHGVEIGIGEVANHCVLKTAVEGRKDRALWSRARGLQGYGGHAASVEARQTLSFPGCSGPWRHAVHQFGGGRIWDGARRSGGWWGEHFGHGCSVGGVGCIGHAQWVEWSNVEAEVRSSSTMTRRGWGVAWTIEANLCFNDVCSNTSLALSSPNN
jgi:hypothetical protein